MKRGWWKTPLAEIILGIVVALSGIYLFCASLPVAGLVVVAVGMAVAIHGDRRRIAAAGPLRPDRYATATPAEQARHQTALEAQQRERYGPVNPVLHCPHCQTVGQVRTMAIEQKLGVSGGKATAAVLTGGVSTLFVGLSRKEAQTRAYCQRCSSSWRY